MLVVVVLVVQLGVNATNGSMSWRGAETFMLIFGVGAAALVAMACAGALQRARRASRLRHVVATRHVERRRVIRTRISLN